MARTVAAGRGPGGVLRALSSTLVGTVAVATTAAVVGTTAAVAPPVSTMPVELSALVAVGSSTNPGGAGVADFFAGRFNPPGTDVRTVNFFTGPRGIHAAIVDTGESNVVLSSGWGAANASALLSWYERTDPGNPVVTDTVWVLDNNVARPNGGWGTRYPVFALIGVNPVPTPEIEGVRVIDIGYQYDANSNAPAYFLNPIADLNSLVAYTQRRLNQAELYLPVQDDGTIVDATDATVPCPTTCTVVVGWTPDGTAQYAEIKQAGDTTYVTYLSDGLPLVQPLRAFGPIGSALADALEPVATVLVNAGYPDNNPTANPDRYVPGRFLPPPDVIGTAVGQLPGAIQQGLDSVRGGSPTTERDAERDADDPSLVTATSGHDDASPTRRPSPNFSSTTSAESGEAPIRRSRTVQIRPTLRPTAATTIDAPKQAGTAAGTDATGAADRPGSRFGKPRGGAAPTAERAETD